MHAIGTEVGGENMAEQAKDSDSFPEHWCNPEWTSWVPFTTAGRELEVIPDKPVLYHIRLPGQDLMMYVLSAQALTGTE
jgi:hypothetical protein